MKWFYDLKIAKKLAIIFTLILMLTSALGIFSVSQLAKVNQSEVDTSDYYVPTLRNTLILQISALRIYASHQQVANMQSNGLSDVPKQYLAEQFAAVQKIIGELHQSLRTDDAKTLLKEVERTFNALQALHNEAYETIEGTEAHIGYGILFNKAPIEALNAIAASRELSDSLYARAAVLKSESIATFETARNMIIGLLLICFIVSIFLAVFIARTISVPLRHAASLAQRVSGGDLTAQINVTTTDETGQLMQSLQAMNQALLQVVHDIRSGTDTISVASREIAAGNLDLSHRTESQASALEETASAMEELTTTVKQNADNALQANQLAASASEIAVQGGIVVDKVVHTMSAINDSSKKIVDIISVIDGIAFQTNILALNAAVEAARAGEQGRGFAVVASEVRNLAQRSASAAKEIKALIDTSVSNVDVGTQLAGEAGTTMYEVVDSIKRVTDIVAEISAASQEQSAGISQVNQAIVQMDEVTQQNAALVEQATAATQSMQQQAAALTQTVSIFQTNGVQNFAAVAQVAPTAKPRNITPKAPALSPQPVRKVVAPTRANQPKSFTSSMQNDKDSWEEF